MVLRASIIAIFMLLPSYVQACSVAPFEYTTHHAILVKNTHDIILAKVIGASDEEGYGYWGKQAKLAKFKTIEVLKGRSFPSLTIQNGIYSEKGNSEREDFTGHSELPFWEKTLTRQINAPDCEMRPVFIQGRTYLLFLGTPHWRAYEEIVVADDQWLKAVRNLIKNPNNETGLSITTSDWFARTKEVFLGSIKNCVGPTLKVEKQILGPLATEWVYSDRDDARSWPLGECVEGRKYIIAKIGNLNSPVMKRYNYMMFEVVNGYIDMSLRRYDEVKIDQEKISVEQIAEFFRN